MYTHNDASTFELNYETGAKTNYVPKITFPLVGVSSFTRAEVYWRFTRGFDRWSFLLVLMSRITSSVVILNLSNSPHILEEDS